MIPPNDPRIDRIAALAPSKVDQLCNQWQIPMEVGRDLVKLALFDIVLYIGECVTHSLPIYYHDSVR